MLNFAFLFLILYDQEIINKKEQGLNEVTLAKPRTPDQNCNLLAVTASPRNVVLTGHFGIFWSAPIR